MYDMYLYFIVTNALKTTNKLEYLKLFCLLSLIFVLDTFTSTFEMN